MKKALTVVIAVLSLTGCADNVSYTSVKTGGAHDCAKAPNVSIDASDETISVTSTCERTLITGGNNKVSIQATKKIEIKGAKNVVHIGSVDDIHASSAGNTITFKTSISGKATNIVTIGDNNSVTQTK